MAEVNVTQFALLTLRMRAHDGLDARLTQRAGKLLPALQEAA